MNDLTRQNLMNRDSTLKSGLGTLAYKRRDLAIQIEEIDKQVAQMEAQAILIEATLNDLNTDQTIEGARQEQERIEAKARRSSTAKAAVAKKKRERAKAGPVKEPTAS